MTRFILAFIACLILTPSLSAQSGVKPDTTFEEYIASYDVNGDGTYTDTTEFLLRLNSKTATESNNPWRVSYNSALQSIEVIEAYTVKKNGKRVLVPASSIQTQLSPEAQAAPEFTSLKIQSVTFPDVKPGDGVFLKIRMLAKKSYLEGHFNLFEIFAVSSLWNSGEVNVSAPPDYPLYWDGVDLEGGRLPDLDGRARWQWKTKVTETIDYEFGATNITDYSPRLVVSSFSDYEALGAAYWAEASKKVAVTPAVQNLADEITKGTSEPEEQARAIYEWVNKNIRYVAILIGRGAFIPHDVSTILKNRYGDCKDYVTILQSLLAAKGIESMPVLVRADDSFWFPKTATIIYFNHVILYLPTLDIYMDATNPGTAFGLLAQGLVGKGAALAGRKTGEIFIPKGKPDENLIRSEIDLTVNDDGGIKARTATSFKGRFEMLIRPLFGDMKPEISSSVARMILEMNGYQGAGKIVEISNAHSTRDVLNIKAEYDLVGAVTIPGPGGLSVPQGLDLTNISELSQLISLEQRKTSIFAGAGHITQKAIMTFPKTLEVSSIPQSVNFVNTAGNYQSSYKVENGVVTITRDIVIIQDVYTTKEYAAFRELITKVIDDSKTLIQYKGSKDYKPSDTVAVKGAATQEVKNFDNISIFEGLELVEKAAKLSRNKVFALESMLLKNPGDLETRLILISYYNGVDQFPGGRQSFVRHRIWLIEKHPERDFKLDDFPYSLTALAESEYGVLKEAWMHQVELKKDNPLVILNAAAFVAKSDPMIAENLLQKGQLLEPEGYKWAEKLGDLYVTRARVEKGDEKAKAFATSIEQFEKALVSNKKERSYQRDNDRLSLLQKLADVAFEADVLGKAKEYATESLIEFGRNVDLVSHVEVAHEENILLGRIALKEGDTAKAKEHLLIAGRTAVQAVDDIRTYFMPEMTLAKELFEKNEKQAVVEYLELFIAAKFEKSKTLKKWSAMIKKGGSPSFDFYEK